MQIRKTNITENLFSKSRSRQSCQSCKTGGDDTIERTSEGSSSRNKHLGTITFATTIKWPCERIAYT